MNNNSKIGGWGVKDKDGSEIWDAPPLFAKEKINFLDNLKLVFYPKKFFLYSFLKKELKKRQTPKILDVGCATGSTLVDLDRVFSKRAKLYGVDVVKMQVDLAKQRLAEYKTSAFVEWYGGESLPFEEDFFDAIYTSDVLGHVKDVDAWLDSLVKVLKNGGVLAMFSESKTGKHALVRNFLLKKGVNVDPHAEFHISLYSKNEIITKLSSVGFDVIEARSSCFRFFTNPEEYCKALKKNKKTVFILPFLCFLAKIKDKLHPFSTAFLEFFVFLQMFLLGRKIEGQGYIILAKKK